MHACHLAKLLPCPPSGLLPTCEGPGPPSISPSPWVRHQSRSDKQEGCLCWASSGQRRRILEEAGKGKTDVPALGQEREHSVLTKYLSNESVRVCRALGTDGEAAPCSRGICHQVNRLR